MKKIFWILQLICIVLFLFLVFYILLLLGSGHKIPFQTFFQTGLSILILVTLYFYVGYIKRKDK